MYIYYQPNPVRSDGVGDCAVRAVAKATDLTWEQAYTELSTTGFLMGDVMNSDQVLAAVLRKHGFVRGSVAEACPDCYSIKDFAQDNPNGTYVVKSNNHVTTIIDGNIFDAWDSSRRVPLWFWKKKDGKEEK